jgi:hypothetical protein
VLDKSYPLPFQRIMRRFEVDWQQNLGTMEVGQVDLEDARLALGLTHTPVPSCFENAFAEGELAV